MPDAPPPEMPDTPHPETGTVRWYDAAKKIGIIIRADGSTVFIPPYGLAEGQPALWPQQPVTFIARTNAKGPYAAEVAAAEEALDDAGIDIAAALGETAPQALGQIARIVRHLGPEATQGFVAEARRVEEAGGMLLPDGSRRRTLGGVFFVLVRDALSWSQRKLIFPLPYGWKAKRGKPKATVPAAEAAPVEQLGWDGRLTLIEELKGHSGKASSVKVTIIGRPQRIEERPQVTLLTLTHAGPLPALPKGVPAPDPVPPTTYSVYIGKRQWKAVAAAIADPEDTLIVEGTQVLDPATGTIAVFATKATTRLLQQAMRQPKPPAEASGE